MRYPLRLLSALVGGLVTTSVFVATPAAAASAPPSSFVLSGSGWGHGVGLSQYGAKAQAAQGRTAAQILAHYYTGTALAAVQDSADVRVQILQVAATSSATASASAGQVRLRTGSTFERVLAAGTTVTFGTEAGQVVARTGSTEVARAGTVVFEWEGTRFYEPSGAAAVVDVPGAGGRYRHGRLEVSVVGGRLNVVNVVRLHDEYLYGIAEMPSSWPAAALDAQAVIARGYGLANYRQTLKSDCACHLYDEVRSQKFTGWLKENETIGGVSYGTRWKDAVRRTSTSTTAGQVVTYGGALATTYYFSSSGGRTQNSEDVWTSAVPYLRSVADPWSADPAVNPTYAAWSTTRTQAQLAGAFKLADVVSLDLSRRTAGGGVDTAVARSSGGAVSSITGEVLRQRLQLPSTYVRRPAVRLAGSDRWATSAAVAREASPSSRTVVVVSGQDSNLVDGLVAAPLARSLGAPVLLVGRDAVPAAIRAELTRRAANRAVVVGGTGAVSDGVLADLRALGLTVERVHGSDRYATAAAVARRVGSANGTAVVASGETTALADALAASGPAAALRRPVLLVRRDSVPAPTSAAIAGLGITGTTCVGGTGVLSEQVRTSLPSCFRASGEDRYATAVAVARAFSTLVPPTRVTVTSGLDGSLVDALGAGTLARLVLLAPATTPPPVVTSWLQSSTTTARLDVVGGTGAVSSGVLVRMQHS